MLHLMGTLSEEIADAFCTEKLVMRCAEMCDYYLVELVGPKCTSLRVKDPEKYNFRPRQMLSDLLRTHDDECPRVRACAHGRLGIFGNLSRNGNFVSAVARDDRSYSDAVLRRSIGIVKQRDLLTADECAALERFADAVKRAKESVVDLDELLGEPPEEFCGTHWGVWGEARVRCL